MPFLEHVPRAHTTGAERQKHCIPASEEARPSPGHLCSIMTLQVSNSVSGETRDTRRGRDALFICAVPCQRHVFSIRIITAKSRLPCGMGNLPKPLEVKECIAFRKWRVKDTLLISNYA